MTLNDFPVPAEDRYFEDYTPGAVFEYGETRVDEAEILDFARRFDPQDMHVDPEKAASGRFGGLIASGWHTAAIMMRLFADGFLPEAASLASPGIDELRWLRAGSARRRAAHPGQRARCRAFQVETRPRHGAHPDRGAEPKRRDRDELETDEHHRLPGAVLKIGIVSDVHCNAAGCCAHWRYSATPTS